MASCPEGTFIYYRLATPEVLTFWWSLQAIAGKRVAEVEILAHVYLGERDELELEIRYLNRWNVATAFSIARDRYMNLFGGREGGAYMISIEERTRRNDVLRRSWAKQASTYDKWMHFFERRVFGLDHRAWAVSRARGKTLEVGVGTGLDLPLYAADLELYGIDLSPEMIAIARERAGALDRAVDLRVGDAQQLPYPSESFDSVVSTYTLCNVPDHGLAVEEMKRVLRPGGRLILVDHIRSSVPPIFWLQKLVEFFSLRFQSETQTRRPLEQVEQAGFEVTERQRMKAGVIERLVAVKNTAGD